MKRNNIKTFRLFFLSTAFITFMVACSERLDISPYQSIGSDKALLTEGDVNATLIGCYDGAQAAAGYGGDIMVLNELTGNTQNINFTGTFAPLNDAYNGSMSSNNSFAASTWISCYNTINRCNNVLSALDKVTSSTDNRDRVEGEASFIRASLYFELVKLYAKSYGDGDPNSNPGVPLVTTPTDAIDETDYVSRSSVKQIYDFVIAELLKAKDLLPDESTRYATSFAAAAQLSRVYLAIGNYAGARDNADYVLTGSGKVLEEDFQDLWYTQILNDGNAPQEYVFFMEVTTQDGTNSLNTYFGRTIPSIPGTSGRSDCKIKSAHLALYEPGDVRGSFFVVSGGNNYSQKHLDTYGDVPVIRLAEMYLTRAEGNVRLGTSVGASPADDVNAIRERAGLDPLGTVALADVLKERMLELAFEGYNLSESKRLQKNVGAFAWNSPKLIFPIPQRETDVNKNLTQNEGY